jgi:hypothetical protein
VVPHNKAFPEAVVAFPLKVMLDKTDAPEKPAAPERLFIASKVTPVLLVFIIFIELKLAVGELVLFLKVPEPPTDCDELTLDAEPPDQFANANVPSVVIVPLLAKFPAKYTVLEPVLNSPNVIVKSPKIPTELVLFTWRFVPDAEFTITFPKLKYPVPTYK